MDRTEQASPDEEAGPRTPVHGLEWDEIARHVARLNLPRFRADQLWQALYTDLVSDWDEVTTLPRALRGELARQFHLNEAVPLRIAGPSDGTRKILAGLLDGERIEEVLIPAAGPGRERRTVCVSSQVGCRYGCTFCASGKAGLVRSLETGEIVVQVLLAARAFEARPTHVVFMGIGEPLDNVEAVLKAIRILNDGRGLGIGARRITVSTCGLVPGIRRLADEGLQIELSVSLHAADDATRSQLMPVNRRHPLDELLDACGRYVKQTGRIVTFEYTLIEGVNADAESAQRLAARLRGRPCRVNLIPLSPVDEFEGRPPPAVAARRFVAVLGRAGVNATVRASKGCGLEAACGQLRLRAQGGRENG